MKERLKELAEQAKLYDGWFCGKGNIEKFAELIVRECAAYAFSDDQDHKAMLNHFGVKE